MRHPVWIGLIILVSAFVVLAGRQPAAVAVPAPGPGGFKWEYKVHSEAELANLTDAKTLEAGLNKLGEDGWELVAVKSVYESTIAAKKNSQALFVLKRLKAGK